jgi:hypothetical protein
MNKTTKKEIEKLNSMKVSELQAKFTGVTAQTTRNPNQTFLIRRITEAAPAREKLTKLDVPTLQARYLEVVSRPMGSDNWACLIWEMHKAQTGRIPVGPRMSAHRGGVSFKLLSLGSFANDSTKPWRGLTERE